MVDDYNGYLKKLAIKLFLVIPHSVTCERTFSMLNFLYEKRRQSFNLNTIKMMSKIWYYLFMNIKQELGHFNREETEIELKDLIEKCGFFDDDLDENDENENDENYENSNEELEIPVHEVQVLIINSVVDMSHSVFTGEFQKTDNNSINEEEEEGENLDDELDFEVIANISAPFNMLLNPMDQTPRPITRDPSSPSYFPNSPYYAEPTIPQPQDTLPGYRSTPPTEAPSSFSDITTHVTPITLASSAAADQAVHAAHDVHPVDHVSDVFPVDDIDHVDDVTDVNPPQYDGSCAWLFEPIISIENSDHE